MKTKTQAKSRILEAVHGTAADLHSAGFISKRRMREYDALCLAPISRYPRKKIRALRQRHGISQAVLATILNTSLSMGDRRQAAKRTVSEASRPPRP